jgi:hypothetical protein
MDFSQINIDQYVNDVLKQFIEQYKIRLFDSFKHITDENEKKQLAILLLDENLLEKLEGETQWNPVCKITSRGIRILKTGGWIKYLEEKEKEKRLSNELIRISIKTNKLQKYLLWITVGLSTMTLIISIMDYYVHAEELRLEQNRASQTLKVGQDLEQNTKTVDPNLDSSANYAADSLGQKVK